MKIALLAMHTISQNCYDIESFRSYFMHISASDRTSNFRYAIRNVVAAADVLRKQGRDIVSLNIGDPQTFGFKPPEYVIEPVVRALRDGFTGYASSAGLFEAREAVSVYANATGDSITPDDVVLTSGASEAADLVLTALLNEGDEVLMPAPGYPLYDAILNKLGAVPRYYRLNDANNWQPDIDEVRSLVTPKTRAVVLINPNNPTGAITADATTTEFLQIAEENNLVVISDEVYRDLCFETAPTPASVLAKGMDVPVITLESLSKTHMLSGWRIGWMRFAKTAKITRLIEAIHRLASGRLCSPTPAQYAVRPALTGDNSDIRAFIGQMRSRRDLAVRMVAETDGISSTVPQSAFYLMVKVADLGGRTDEQFVIDLLQQSGVLAVHGSGFGTRPDEGYFRIVYLADEPTLKRAFDGIALMTGKHAIPVFNSDAPNRIAVG